MALRMIFSTSGKAGCPLSDNAVWVSFSNLCWVIVELARLGLTNFPTVGGAGGGVIKSTTSPIPPLLSSLAAKGGIGHHYDAVFNHV